MRFYSSNISFVDTLQKEIEYSSKKAEWINNNFDIFSNEITSRRLPIFQHLIENYNFHGRVLEIGAGSAWLSALISRIPEVKKVYALDISKELLEIAEMNIIGKLKGDKSKIEFINADFSVLPFENGMFDIIVCDASLHHAKDLSTLLKDVLRVLKTGGYLLAIREPIKPLFFLRKFGASEIAKGATENTYSKTEWKAYFEKAGLELNILEDFSQYDLKTSIFRKFPMSSFNGILFSRYHFFAKKYK